MSDDADTPPPAADRDPPFDIEPIARDPDPYPIDAAFVALSPTAQKAIEALNALGEEPTEIAERLQGLGEVGECGEPDRCPLSNYLWNKLKPQVPELRRVSVYGEHAVLVCDAGLAEVHLPTPHRDFAAMFDEEFYPALIADPDPENDWP